MFGIEAIPCGGVVAGMGFGLRSVSEFRWGLGLGLDFDLCFGSKLVGVVVGVKSGV